MLTGDRGMAFKGIAFSRKDATGRNLPVLKHLDAKFESGHITLIQGAVGAGKSTLLHLAAGLMRPDEGEILAHGVPISRYPASFRDNWRKSVGIIFQHLKLFGGLTVFENVLLPLIPRSKQTFSIAEKRCGSLLEQLNLSLAKDRKVGTLSGGERQRVAVARAMAGDPDFIIADEPFAHQDEAGISRILQLFFEAANRDKTVIIAAHALPSDPAFGIERHLSLDNGQLFPRAMRSEPEK